MPNQLIQVLDGQDKEGNEVISEDEDGDYDDEEYGDEEDLGIDPDDLDEETRKKLEEQGFKFEEGDDDEDYDEEYDEEYDDEEGENGNLGKRGHDDDDEEDDDEEAAPSSSKRQR